jgi:hypothetical protein
MKVTKWSIITGGFDVSEHQADQTSDEPGSLIAGPDVSVSTQPREPVAAAASVPPEINSPDLVPEQGAAAGMEAPKAEVIAADAPKADAPKADAPKADAPKADTPKADAARPEASGAAASRSDAPRAAGKVMIMASADRFWNGNDEAAAEPEPETHQGMFGRRRLAALAAVVALAVVAGALGGALATAGLARFAGNDAASAGTGALEASVARIDADIAALKTSVEHGSRMSLAQFSKTTDRLDKVEKAQLEPAVRLAKLSEAVEKLRTAPPAAPVPVAAAPAAAKEVTGSISPPAAAPSAAPKAEVARLPTVEGWLLRDVANGGALIEGRQGIFEVYAGDPVPGLGRVDAIRRQDGRWVVVTSKGLIVAR